MTLAADLETTLDRRRSKTLLTIEERGSKVARNSVFIAICRQLEKSVSDDF